MKKIKYLLIAVFAFCFIGNVSALEVTEDLTLTSDISDGIHVSKGKNVTINLNGYKVSGCASTTGSSDSNKATIVNEGSLTITGSGTVEGGKDNGYTILNRNGNLTINGGTYITIAEVTSTSGPSLIANGWYTGSQNLEGEYSVLTINDGTFTGGLNNVKNDEYGKLTINGGTYEDASYKAIITGGKSFKLTGGNINGSIFAQIQGADTQKEFEVTGGSFNGSSISFESHSAGDKNKLNTYTKVLISNIEIGSIAASSEIQTGEVLIKNVKTTNASNDLTFKTTGSITFDNVKSNKYANISAPEVTIKDSTFSRLLLKSNEGILTNNNITDYLAGSQKTSSITITGGEYNLVECYSSDRSAVGATITINDGVFNLVKANSKGNIIISGGTFNGAVSAQYLSTLKIKGGTFNDNVLNAETGSSNPTIEISGGTFLKTSELKENGFIVEGYTTYSIDETSYAVDEKTSVSGKNVIIRAGETASLSIIANDIASKYLKVSLSDESIATIKGMNITGIKAGTCEYTIDLNDGSTPKTYTVSVYNIVSDGLDSEDLKVVDNVLDKIIAGKKVDGIDDATAEKISLAILQGQELSIDIQSNKISDVDKDELKAIQKVAGNSTIVSYYDIVITINSSDNKLGNITNLEKEITIELAIPDDLPKVKDGYTRKFYIFRYHDGKVEKLDASVNGKKASAKSDKFSTYALAYEDVANKDNKTESGASSINSNASTESTPNTIDNIVFYASLFILSMGAIIITKKAIVKIAHDKRY